jgi:hypothetical protein
MNGPNTPRPKPKTLKLSETGPECNMHAYEMMDVK